MVPPARTIRVRGFEHADLWFNRLVKFITALHEGFWLGCLSADDLNAVTAAHFDESRLYASKEHNLSGLLGWETPVVERYFRPRSRILVAAAGAGREVLALRKAGFDAGGFECSPPLVRVGREIFDELCESNYITLCAPDFVPPGPPTYEGLIVGWGGYTHIPTRTRRIRFLQSLRQRAFSGSPLLVSFFTRRGNSAVERVVYRTAMLCRFLFRGREESLDRGDHLEWSRYVHRFTREELEAELGDAGFSIGHYGEDSASSAHAVGFSK